MHQKPLSLAAEKNKQPIYEVLRKYLETGSTILEIGSGTGQHCTFFSEKFPEIIWQPSDQQCKNLIGLDKTNILKPINLDVNLKNQWPKTEYEHVYTANTCHIMSWHEVLLMIELVGTCLKINGSFFCYGPFIFSDRKLKQSNINFDTFLKNQKSSMGLRSVDDIKEAALQNKLELVEIHDMPANNNILVFEYLK